MINSPITKQFEVGKPVSHIRLAPTESSQFVVGGKENDLAVWDIELKKNIWQARNVLYCEYLLIC
jgi:hypothetical protein